MFPFLPSVMMRGFFPPVTRTYTSGVAATETVPAGATLVTVRTVGGGGSGAKDIPSGAGGGGSAAYSSIVIAVTGGNTFTYTVGTGGAGQAVDVTMGNNGVDSTVSGTVAGGTINLVAGKGFAGNVGLSAGPGGTASGGSTNTPGNAAIERVGGVSVYSTYGKGSNGKETAGSSLAGGNGVAIFEYT